MLCWQIRGSYTHMSKLVQSSWRAIWQEPIQITNGHILCIRVLQRNRTNTIYICVCVYIYNIYIYIYLYLYLHFYILTYIRGDLVQELTHVLMEAEKPQNLPSASWRTRKASGMNQFESKGPRTRGVDGIIPRLRLKAYEPGGYWFKSQCLKAQKPGTGKDGHLSSRRERGNLPFLHLFILFGSSTDWVMPTCT